MLWWVNGYRYFHLNNLGDVYHYVIMTVFLMTKTLLQTCRGSLGEDPLCFFFFFLPYSTSPPLRWCKLGITDRPSSCLSASGAVRPSWPSHSRKAPGFTYSWHFTFVARRWSCGDNSRYFVARRRCLRGRYICRRADEQRLLSLRFPAQWCSSWGHSQLH